MKGKGIGLDLERQAKGMPNVEVKPPTNLEVYTKVYGVWVLWEYSRYSRAGTGSRAP